MYSALRLGLRDALHTMCTGFEFQPRIDVGADDPNHHLLVAAVFADALADHLRLPAPALGISQVHAQQIAGKQRRFGTTGTGPHFEIDVALVIGVARQQQALQLGLQCAQRGAGILAGVLGELGHFRVGQHGLGAVQFDLRTCVPLIALADRFELCVLTTEIAKAVGVGLHVRVGQQYGDLLEALADLFEFVADTGFHRQGLSQGG